MEGVHLHADLAYAPPMRLILTVADLVWDVWLEVVEATEFALEAVFRESGQPQG
jgi:hypothetical protein